MKIFSAVIISLISTILCTSLIENQSLSIDKNIKTNNSERFCALDTMLYNSCLKEYGEKWYWKNDIYVSVYLYFTDKEWNNYVYEYKNIEGDSTRLVNLCNHILNSAEFRSVIKPNIEEEKKRFKERGDSGFYVRFNKLKRF